MDGKVKKKSNQGNLPAVPLTKATIVTAASRLIDQGGAKEFSMRSLAKAMGVYPTALYWHVGEREQLLAAVGSRWMRGVVPPAMLDDWESWLRDLSHRYRAACHRHPNIARLIGNEIFNGNSGLSIADGIIAHLVASGIPDSEIVNSYNALTGSVVGFISLEFAQLSENHNPDWAVNTAAELAGLDARQFPYLVRYMDQLTDRAFSLRWTSGVEKPLNESYEFLIDLLMDGIKARAIRQPEK
ncbi:MAG: TetR/AcrR family transcriptional regulator [Actinobacteria bacterium]|nr:TetR/AcrR family transcriptional regulator [Actinomycetota bacterium]